MATIYDKDVVDRMKFKTHTLDGRDTQNYLDNASLNFEVARNQLIADYLSGAVDEEKFLIQLNYGLLLWIESRKPEYDRLVACIKTIIHVFQLRNIDDKTANAMLARLQDLFASCGFEQGSNALKEITQEA